MTELAVIAPVSALEPITSLRYQWALTSKLENRSYSKFFLHQSDCNKHVTLMQDNNIQPFQLAQLAEEIGARELVLPYVENNYYETLASIEETLMGMAVSRSSAEILRGLRPHILLVPPMGADVFKWSSCLNSCLATYLEISKKYPKLFPFTPTIGLRSLELLKLEPELELSYVRDIVGYYVSRHSMQIHLFEWNTLTTFGLNFRSVSTMIPYMRAAGIYFNITPRFLDRRFTEAELIVAKQQVKSLRKKV